MIAAAADAVAGLSDADPAGRAAAAAGAATCARSRRRSPSRSPRPRSDEGLAQAELDDPIQQVHEAMWRPEYAPIVAV